MATWNEFESVSTGSGEGSNSLNLFFTKEERVEFKINTNEEPQRVEKDNGKVRWYIPIKLLVDVEDTKGRVFKAGDEITLNATDYLRSKLLRAFQKAKKKVTDNVKIIVEKEVSDNKNDWKVTVA